MGTEAGKDTFRKQFERLGISCSRTLAKWVRGGKMLIFSRCILRWMYFECLKCVGVLVGWCVYGVVVLDQDVIGRWRL